MSKHTKQAESFRTWAETQGFGATAQTAQTGTVYVTLTSEGHEFIARFADHSECYTTADISVDAEGCSLAQAKAAAVAFFADPAPREAERIEERRDQKAADVAAAKYAAEAARKSQMKVAEMTPEEVAAVWPLTTKQIAALQNGDAMLARQIARKIKTTPASVLAAAKASRS